MAQSRPAACDCDLNASGQLGVARVSGIISGKIPARDAPDPRTGSGAWDGRSGQPARRKQVTAPGFGRLANSW
ncbi:hypothetical protein Misp05_22360 [Micromonospora sp. NBRC 107095]|nr:hypothetical protein Misp05_22360 [Micromonospora sp. NBRC 107095]